MLQNSVAAAPSSTQQQQLQPALAAATTAGATVIRHEMQSSRSTDTYVNTTTVPFKHSILNASAF
jgi:hypothetical protein